MKSPSRPDSKFAAKNKIKTHATPSEVRLIAGKYRGRKIRFKEAPGLRPTGDRLRETLFSWLQTKLPGARCLDLFTGSGALGFEAASRGAALVQMVEFNRESFQMLQSQQQALQATEVQLFHADAMQFLQEQNQAYDVIFLDPPFNGEWLARVLPLIAQKQLLNDAGLIYLELERQSEWPTLPPQWHWYRQKEAGQVKYGLAQQPSSDSSTT